MTYEYSTDLGPGDRATALRVAVDLAAQHEPGAIELILAGIKAERERVAEERSALVASIEGRHQALTDARAELAAANATIEALRSKLTIGGAS